MSTNLSDMIRLDLPATYKYLSILSACISELLARVEELPDREAVTYNVQLAVHEVCINIVDHAYDGNPEGRIAITLSFDEQPHRLLADLHDSGRSFDLSGVAEPNLDEAHDHGYGLLLIRNLVDEVSYTPRKDGNHWRLVKYL